MKKPIPLEQQLKSYTSASLAFEQKANRADLRYVKHGSKLDKKIAESSRETSKRAAEGADRVRREIEEKKKDF